MYSFGLSPTLSQGGVEVIPDNEPRFSLIRRVVLSRVSTRNLHLSHANQPMFTHLGASQDSRAGRRQKTEQGRSCWQEFSRGFAELSYRVRIRVLQ
jgi:hypothetical protein